MALTFKLEALKQLPVGETASGKPLTKGGRTGWARPLEALPLTLHRILFAGTVDEPSSAAVWVYEADRVMRTVLWPVGIGVAGWLGSWALLLETRIGTDDVLLWASLGVWWLVLTMHLVARLVGRVAPLPASVSDAEIRDRAELQIPAVIYNFQPFGVRSWAGKLAAAIVTFIELTWAVSWGTLLYCAYGRMLANDAWEPSYSILVISYLVYSVISAFARSASLNDLRPTTAKLSAPLTGADEVRVTLVTGYTFIVLTCALPLTVASLEYTRV